MGIWEGWLLATLYHIISHESIQAERRNVVLPKITWTLVNNNWGGHTQSSSLSLLLGIKVCCWNRVCVKVNFCCNISCFSWLHSTVVLLISLKCKYHSHHSVYSNFGKWRIIPLKELSPHGSHVWRWAQLKYWKSVFPLPALSGAGWGTVFPGKSSALSQNWEFWHLSLSDAPKHLNAFTSKLLVKIHLDLFIRYVLYWDWSTDTEESEIALMISCVSDNHMGKGRIKATSQ